MPPLELKVEPVYYDEYGQPCYALNQEKGLFESQDLQLLEDALADGYTAAVAADLHRLVKQQVLLASDGRTIDIVEIGGGGGYFFDCVKEIARSYINIEPGRIALNERAVMRLKDSGYRCIKCSAEDIPLYDESVDVILTIASFDHIPDYRKALAEARRLLRKGGLFVLVMNNRRSWWKLLLSRTDYLRKREEKIAQEHYILWSLSECEAHLSNFMPVIKIHSTTFIPFMPRVWKILLPVTDFFGRLLLPKYGANIIAICKKTS